MAEQSNDAVGDADDTTSVDDVLLDLEKVAIRFAEGIPGFPDAKRFALLTEVEDAAFHLLQCLDDANVGLIVTVPWLFFPDYAPVVSALETSLLELENPEDAAVFCPVTLDAEHDLIYVNLLGPFVVNVERRIGRQLVLTESDYPVRAPVDLSGL